MTERERHRQTETWRERTQGEVKRDRDRERILKQIKESCCTELKALTSLNKI